jgi:uncharacterized protein (DUF58 family)
MLPQTLIDRLRYVEIYTARSARTQRAGDYLSPIRGRGFEFDQHKPYQRGDDYRQIDWNVTARMNAPFVKREFEEKELSAVVMVDLSRSTLFSSADLSKRALSLEVAAMLAFSAAADNMNVGLLAFTDRIECQHLPRKGRRNVWQLMETLWELQPKGRSTDFAPALEWLNTTLKSSCVIFCLSDFIASGPLWDLPYLKSAAHKHDFVPVILEDRWEEEMPPVKGYLRLRDAEDGGEMVLAMSPRRCREYGGLLAQRRTQLHNRLYSLNMDHVSLTTGEDYMKRIMAFFGARKRRTGK